METPILADEYELWARDFTTGPSAWLKSVGDETKTYEFTLWLCQISYWKWPLIVDFPIKNGDFP